MERKRRLITEQYVGLDTAKILKEAGFDVPCQKLFLASGMPGITEKEENHNDVTCNAYSRPTQALASRWLREKHRIALDVAFIPPSIDGDVWQYFVGEMDDMIWKGDYETGRKYATYEQAMEAGLQEAIKLIKK